MAKEKARGYLEHVMKNPELIEKMKGFTQEELKEAFEDLKKDGKIKEDDELTPNDFY